MKKSPKHLRESSSDEMIEPKTVLEFWFGGENPQKRWYKKDPAFDAEIRETFGNVIEAAGRGELDSWKEKPESCLALVIVLDQFSRNAYRDTPKAFAFDAKAREVTKEAIEAGHNKKVKQGESFFYMPLEHSEDIEDQEFCMKLMPGNKWAKAHYDIIACFGRFPHRNKILGRKSTPEEIEFLKQPGSSF